MKFYIHIGFPKTGTSKFQKTIFSEIPNIDYLGKSWNVKRGKFISYFKEIENSIIFLNDDEFREKKEKLKKIIKIKIDQSRFDKFLISNEDFLNKSVNSYRTINRLNYIFSEIGEVNFLITIRNHTEMLISYVNEFNLNLDAEYENLKTILQNKKNGKSKILDKFKYGDLYYFLKEKKINYKFFLFKEFKYDKKNFFVKLQKFLSIDQTIHYEIFDEKYENESKNKELSKVIIKAIKKINFMKKRLWKYKFSNKHYKLYFKFIKFRFKYYFSFKKNKINFLIKNKKIILKYYEDDIKKLPNDIFESCQKYNYLKR